MIVSDGIDRKQRAPAAFVENYFGVNELTFEQMLVRCSRLAKNLQFFDLDNRSRGTWDELFLSGEMFVLARILAIDIDTVETQFRNSVDTNGISGAAAEILSIAEALDGWQDMLMGSESENGQAMGMRISELIDERLIGDLHTVAGWLLRNERNAENTRKLSEFSRVWGLRDQDDGFAIAESRLVTEDRPDAMLGQFRRFSKTLVHVKRLAEERWPAVASVGVANPALGLAIAFLRQYGKVQHRLNEFSSRHRYFYYQDVLNSRPRPPQTDSADIVVQSDGTRARFTIPAGTLFTAGPDEAGRKRVYSSDSDLLVRNGRVEGVRVLRVSRDSAKAPENALGYVTAAQAEIIGNDIENDEVVRRVSRASLGLGIASPVLRSVEGDRSFDVSAEFSFATDAANDLEGLQSSESDEDVRHLLGRLFARYVLSRDDASAANIAEGLSQFLRGGSGPAIDDESLSLVMQYLKMDRQALFHFLLRDSFSLRLTTADGWLDVEDFVLSLVAPDDAETALRFRFTLPADGPEVVNSNVDLHGVAAPASAPLLQLRLNSHAHFNALSVFNEVVLARVKVALAVTGATGLAMSNDFGALDTSTSFLPFGPQPASGATLFIGNSDLAAKMPDTVSFDLEWTGLPSVQGGFATHYRHYPSRFRNGDYNASIAVLANGHWHQIGGTSSTALFAVDSSTDRLQPQNRLPVSDLGAWQASESPAIETYSRESRNGFIRLRLDCPQHGFGHIEHMGLTARAIARNSKLKIPLPLPTQPYTPTLNRVVLNYTASTVIDLGAEFVDYAESRGDSVRHIVPFGLSRPGTGSGGSGCGLLPQLDRNGALLIGYTAGSGGGRLSLHIGIGAGPALDLSAETPHVDWSYLREDEWVPIEDARVIHDTTRGFLSSGIVVLDIPDDISASNTSMPSGNFWLKAAPTGPTDRTGRVHAVHMGAVSVTASGDPGENASSDDSRLPAGSITALAAGFRGVASVFQLDASRGRAPAESPAEHAIRVSERLRHKHRAVTAWDYERLVLEKFGTVYKVKCFATLGMPAPDAMNGVVLSPGDVLIVTVPRVGHGDSGSSGGPVFDADELRSIRDYVTEIAPPGATVHVRNPVYERIQVRCSVAFEAAAGSGTHLRRLNAAIGDYLSPWRLGAPNARFGWRIRCHDVESFVRELPYVAAVSSLSLLQISQGDDTRYTLGDTARAVDGDKSGLIDPRFPWSLAIPFRRHSIRPLGAPETGEARAAGISDLALGSTFIL